jgi:hypothetical protein
VMIKHGFSYADLKEMHIDELRFWAQKLNEYYEKLNNELDDAIMLRLF